MFSCLYTQNPYTAIKTSNRFIPLFQKKTGNTEYCTKM